MALANMASVIVGATFQPIIGWLLVIHSTGLIENGVPVYVLSDYKTALIILPLCSVLGLFTAFFVKETHCDKFHPETEEVLIHH